MRRYIPALLLALTAFAPFPLAGCDLINKLKGGEAADAAPEAAAAEVVIDAAPVVDEAVADAAPALKPTVVAKKVDAGVDASADAAPAATADASAAIADAGAQLADAATKLLTRPDGGKITIPKGLLKRIGQ